MAACLHPFHGRLQRIGRYSRHDLSTLELGLQQLSEVAFLVCFLHNLHQQVILRTGQILLLSFDQNAAFTEKPKLESIFFVTKTRGYFDELQPGDPITKVQSIDPTGFYPFLIEGSDAPKVSEHFTEDGYHTTVTYDADLNIMSVDYDVA